jgi:hypothetical protein
MDKYFTLDGLDDTSSYETTLFMMDFFFLFMLHHSEFYLESWNNEVYLPWHFTVQHILLDGCMLTFVVSFFFFLVIYHVAVRVHVSCKFLKWTLLILHERVGERWCCWWDGQVWDEEKHSRPPRYISEPNLLVKVFQVSSMNWHFFYYNWRHHYLFSSQIISVIEIFFVYPILSVSLCEIDSQCFPIQ